MIVCFPAKKQNKTDTHRVPISCGEQQLAYDGNSSQIPTFDAVFHPETIQKALMDVIFKNFICEVAMNNIAQKYKFEMSGPIKYPNSSYKVFLFFNFFQSFVSLTSPQPQTRITSRVSRNNHLLKEYENLQQN